LLLLWSPTDEVDATTLTDAEQESKWGNSARIAVVATVRVWWETATIDTPEIQYARSGDVSIAYQVAGDGAVDLVFVPFLFNLAFGWTHPAFRRLLDRLTSFARVIVVDKRGTGLSDRFRELPTLETRMDDLRAVLNEVGTQRTALLGSFEGAQMTALFAATYPDRTQALALYNPVARFVSAADYPWGTPVAEWRALVRRIGEQWGRRAFMEEHLRAIDPELARDPGFVDWYVMFFRLAASPGSAAAFYRMIMETDIREVLPAIRVPTLVCFRDDYDGPARFVAEQIPSARALAFPGVGYLPSAPESMFEALEAFLLGTDEERDPDRVLATILFTDVSASTELAARVGDRAWAELLRRHHGIVRTQLARFRGHEVDTAGDGFLATFEGPARAIRCACAARDEIRSLGMEIRAGVHTGECELVGGKVAGLAVNIGARVVDAAGPGEVFVSSTVKDLVAGSGIGFDDRGDHELRGVGSWHLYAVHDV